MTNTSTTVAPNTFFDGLVTAVPGSGQVTVDAAVGQLDLDRTQALAEALAAAQAVAGARLGPTGSTLHSEIAYIAEAFLERTVRDVRLVFELEILGYVTELKIPDRDGQIQRIMELLGVWSLREVVGSTVEVLYSNDPGTNGTFLNANGSIVRALRDLDNDPAVLIH